MSKTEFEQRRREEFELVYEKEKDAFKIFKIGWLMGMQKAAEIAAESHPPRLSLSAGTKT